MNKQQHANRSSKKLDYTVDLFEPEDAPGVGSLFREVYGDKYPIRYLYKPTELITEFQQKNIIPIVVHERGGRIIGYISLYRSSPNPRLYEIGTAIVHADFRGAGISKALQAKVINDLHLGDQAGLQAVFGEAVCNHLHTQKSCSRLPHLCETGIEVDLMPAEAYEQERSSTGRVASVIVYRAYAKAANTVFVPEIYEDFLTTAYRGLEDDRTLKLAPSGIPSRESGTQISTQRFEFASALRVNTTAIAEDFSPALERTIENEARDFHLVQVWLKLSDPHVGFAVEALRQRGFFLGGVLPVWFEDGDGLLLQRLASRPNWEGIQLYSDKAKRMLEQIHADWEDVNCETSLK